MLKPTGRLVAACLTHAIPGAPLSDPHQLAADLVIFGGGPPHGNRLTTTMDF